MKIKNYAKVNIALNVVKKLDNHYHELDMCNVCVSLKDTMNVRFHKHQDEIKIICKNDKVPTDETNTMVQVIQKVKKQFHLQFGCEITLNKQIPLESGLGGGSGNAAALLELLNEHFKLKMNKLQMINFIKDISADACYLLTSVPARVKGCGEIIKPFKNHLTGKLFLVKPISGVETKKVYQAIKVNEVIHPNLNKICDAMRENDVDMLKKYIGNSLQAAAIQINPEIQTTLEKLKTCGFEIVSMSGSGSTCFAYSKNKKCYQLAKKVFSNPNYELAKAYTIKQNDYIR